MINDRNKADELEVLILVLLGGPNDGLTIESIQAATRWPDALIHRRLLDLGSKVGNEKRRVDKVKSTYYFLKVR